ncbi:hypothetical protein YC2023_047719 [Brassica napus]
MKEIKRLDFYFLSKLVVVDTNGGEVNLAQEHAYALSCNPDVNIVELVLAELDDNHVVVHETFHKVKCPWIPASYTTPRENL